VLLAAAGVVVASVAEADLLVGVAVLFPAAAVFLVVAAGNTASAVMESAVRAGSAVGGLSGPFAFQALGTLLAVAELLAAAAVRTPPVVFQSRQVLLGIPLSSAAPIATPDSSVAVSAVAVLQRSVV